MARPPGAISAYFTTGDNSYGSRPAIGMWAFLAGDGAMFVVLLLGYVAMRTTTPAWPDPSAVLNRPLAIIMTVALFGGSLALVKALAAVRSDRQSALRVYLATAVVCGLIFLILQYYEWSHLGQMGVRVAEHPFGASQFSGLFYIITGFHGGHVAVGVLYLVFVLSRSFRGEGPSEQFYGILLGGMYWHFLDLLWVMIFSTMYIV